jgi:hypothetical protein
MLHRQIYRGKLVRNKFRKVKNPDTGRHVVRLADPDDLIEVDVPNLRIVSEQLWNAAHAVRLRRRAKVLPGFDQKVRPTLVRKPRLLAGLIRCATCQGEMTVHSSTRGGQVGCSNARYRQTCSHAKLYDLGAITREVLGKMEKELANPEFLQRRMKARALELAKAEREENSERKTAQRQLDRLNVQIGRLVALIDDDTPIEEVKANIRAKEMERVALREKLRLLGAGSNVIELQPTSMTDFARKVETLADLLRRNPEDAACRAALANVVDRVLVHPTPKKAPYELSLYARLSAVRNVELFPRQRTDREIVAEEGGTQLFVTGNKVTSN